MKRENTGSVRTNVITGVTTGLLVAFVTGVVGYFLVFVKLVENFETAQRDISELRTTVGKLVELVNQHEGRFLATERQLSAAAIASTNPNISYPEALQSVERLSAEQSSALFDNLPSLVRLNPQALTAQLATEYGLTLQADELPPPEAPDMNPPRSAPPEPPVETEPPGDGSQQPFNGDPDGPSGPASQP